MEPQPRLIDIGFGHKDDPKLHAHVDDWDEFKRSMVWKDIEAFLKDRLRGVIRDMRDAKELQQMFQLQQEASDIEFFLELPNFLRSQREEQDEEDRESLRRGDQNDG